MKKPKYTILLVVLFMIVDSSCVNTYQTETISNLDTSIEILSENEIRIANQIWMRNNLNVSTFRNGDIIREAKTDQEWTDAAYYKQPAWCYYDNDPGNEIERGKLYNWYAVNDERGLAPVGWHIPNQKECSKLISVLECYHLSKVDSIGLLKKDGCRSGDNGEFLSIDFFGYWWSSTETENNSLLAHKIRIDLINSCTVWFDGKCNGLSVRCIKD
jgi:uncharacterized protein (TIGR02145 family)